MKIMVCILNIAISFITLSITTNKIISFLLSLITNFTCLCEQTSVSTQRNNNNIRILCSHHFLHFFTSYKRNEGMKLFFPTRQFYLAHCWRSWWWWRPASVEWNWPDEARPIQPYLISYVTASRDLYQGSKSFRKSSGSYFLVSFLQPFVFGTAFFVSNTESFQDYQCSTKTWQRYFRLEYKTEEVNRFYVEDFSFLSYCRFIRKLWKLNPYHEGRWI